MKKSSTPHTFIQAVLPAICACAAFAPAHVAAQATQLDTVTVIGSANRTTQDVRDVPRSVTVIAGAQLQDQLSKGLDIADMLGRLVPGMATSAEGRNNARGQDQIRGRRFLLLIDGIPQDRTYLDTRQDFKSVAAEAIERIEVIRGGTAIYGLNSTGGIINIITKSGRSGAVKGTSAVKILPNNGGSLGLDIYNQVHGGNDQFAYFVGVDWLRSEGRYDALGQLIPSGNTGSADFNDTKNLNLKLSANVGELNRLSYSLNLFDSKDHDRYYPCRGVLPAQGSLALTARYNSVALCGAAAPTVANAGTTAPAQGTVAQAVQIPIGADDPTVSAAAIAAGSQPYSFLIANHALSLDLDGTPLGDVTATLYHQRRSALTASFNFTRSAANPPSGVVGFGFNDLAQQRTGLRTTVSTPLPMWGSSLGNKAKLVWGVDLERQSFSQPNSIGVVPTSPDFKQSTVGPFAQIEAQAGAWKLSGGARFEQINVDIPSFQTSPSLALLSHPVAGGRVRYTEPLLNVGAVYDVNPELQAFASASQGLNLGEVLRSIRGTTKLSVAAAITDIQPVKVDAFEVGVRGQQGQQGQPASLRWSAALFLNRSALGATITRDPVTDTLSTVRAPEKVKGAEFTLDWDATGQFALGGSLSYQAGERSLSGLTEALPGTRITPLKLAAYGRYAWAKAHFVQLDIQHSGARNEFPNGAVNRVFSANVVGGDAEGAGEVKAVTLASVSYSQAVWKGVASVAVNNIANRFYVPTTLQALNDPRAYYAGQGRAFSASYRIDW